MARAAPKYPRNLNVLILAEANSGTGPTTILRMVNDGSLDGLERPIKMPDGTFWDRWHKLKREVEPASRVPQGEEIHELDSLMREVITMLRREIERIKKEQRKGRLTPGDVGTLRSCGKTAMELKRGLGPTNAKGPQAAATQANRDAAKTPLQERAARFYEKEQENGTGEDPASDPSSSKEDLGNGAALGDDGGVNGRDCGPSHAQAAVEPTPIPA